MSGFEVIHGYRYDMDATPEATLRFSPSFIERLLFKGIITLAGAEYLRKGAI